MSRASTFAVAHAVACLAALPLSACGWERRAADDDAQDEVARPIVCRSDLGLVAARITGDRGELDARVRCQSGDCADRRSVEVGASFAVEVEIPDAVADAESVEIRSSDPAALRLEGFDRSMACRNGFMFSGVASFETAAEAALMVLSGGEELDRFTATAHTPARLEIQASPGIHLFESDGFVALDELAFAELYEVRVRVYSASNERLIGGSADVRWSVDDPKIATLTSLGHILNRANDMPVANELDPSVGLSTLLEPVAIGNTVLRVERGSLATELALEVTGVPVPVGDSAAEQ